MRSYRWNPQGNAGAGYAVVFIDFHGSLGYGQAFTDSISQDWGQTFGRLETRHGRRSETIPLG